MTLSPSQPDGAALRQKFAEYAQDLRRNPSGADDYPWEIMRAVASRIDEILASPPPAAQSDVAAWRWRYNDSEGPWDYSAEYPKFASFNLDCMTCEPLYATPPASPARITGATDIVDEAACLIWSELCPGMVMGDEDRPHYEAAAKAVLAVAALASQGATREAVIEALEPFAKLADAYDAAHEQRVQHHKDEGEGNPPKPHSDGHRVSVSMGELRAAQRALRSSTGSSEVRHDAD